ncbi:ammonium transporter AmtB-like domain-containing protein [Limtongia smithiae]|uniref:ammonium transporter AmtB-like domain-containing protein n=1 Tax=Limtongia smithiae TaxID=1125753 RepID=UPI0034CF7C89
MFQGLFCAVTGAIIVGASAERGRLIPVFAFCFVWATLVYCPLTCWIWNSNGWAAKFGVLDYAGGGPVEIGSGFSGLAYAWVLGPRLERTRANSHPHDLIRVAIGTLFLWFGWLAFNGASSLGANFKALYACFNSSSTAVTAMLSWCLIDFVRQSRVHPVALSSGIISGLVAATPTSGMISFWSSAVLGLVTGPICYLGTQPRFKTWLRIDDSMDILVEHGVAGIIGLLWNAFFAMDSIIASDGATLGVAGGWLNRNWVVLGKQIAYICACAGYSFVVSTIICHVINRIPGLRLRADEKVEMCGMDCEVGLVELDVTVVTEAMPRETGGKTEVQGFC